MPRVTVTQARKLEHIYYLKNLNGADTQLKVRLRGSKGSIKWLWSEISANGRDEIDEFLEATFPSFTHDHDGVQDFMGSSSNRYSFMEYEPAKKTANAGKRCFILIFLTFFALFFLLFSLII